MAQICADVADKWGIDVAEIRGPSTRRRAAWPRQHFMALARDAGFSTTQIALFLGKKDHTCVIHGARRHLEREGAAG
jgi:chromosomal replication initiation ATPase DnaA